MEATDPLQCMQPTKDYAPFKDNAHNVYVWIYG